MIPTTRETLPRYGLYEMGETGRKYLDLEGGLYGGGSNTVPTAHNTTLLSAAGAIVPRNTGGTPAGSGAYVMVPVGPSNPRREWEEVEDLFDANRIAWGVDSHMQMLNIAESGYASQEWANFSNDIWTIHVPAAVDASAYSRFQVCAAWLEMPRNYEGGRTYNLKDPDAEPWQLARDTADTLRNLKNYFPNMEIAFPSGRSYGGWNPPNQRVNRNEAYLHQFGIRDLIMAQIDVESSLHGDTYGDLSLSAMPALVWGPLLYDGPDFWERKYYQGHEDCQNDGNFEHLCGEEPNNGELLVANMITDFLRTSPYAVPWFLS